MTSEVVLESDLISKLLASIRLLPDVVGSSGLPEVFLFTYRITMSPLDLAGAVVKLFQE